MDTTVFLQLLLPGLTTGCVYALVALGFVLCANVSGVVNFAQGEFIMLGGMVDWTRDAVRRGDPRRNGTRRHSWGRTGGADTGAGTQAAAFHPDHHDSWICRGVARHHVDCRRQGCVECAWLFR
jgi:Branched-chain amino acid transport system / permease component